MYHALLFECLAPRHIAYTYKNFYHDAEIFSPVLAGVCQVRPDGVYMTTRWQHFYLLLNPAPNLLLIMAPFCLCSQNPTSDEVLSWSQNFDKMMKAPAGRNLFREFLRTEYSEENLLFWLACEDLKKEQNKKVIEEKARMIYDDYISILSPKEVKIWKGLMWAS